VHPGLGCVNAVEVALRSSDEASRELLVPLHRLPTSLAWPMASVEAPQFLIHHSRPNPPPLFPPTHTALQFSPPKSERTTVLRRSKHTYGGQAEVNVGALTKLRRKVIKKCASNSWRTCAACTSRREWTQTKIYPELARHACTLWAPGLQYSHTTM
jgi:hypothetical protein